VIQRPSVSYIENAHECSRYLEIIFLSRSLHRRLIFWQQQHT